MSSKDSDVKSVTNSGLGTKNNSSKKEEKKNFSMEKKPFYNPELISKRKVIINTSTSKQMYSFPTSKRFNDYVKDESSFFYNIRTPFTKRSTSFGYGSKVVFSDSNKYPGPGEAIIIFLILIQRVVTQILNCQIVNKINLAMN